MAQHTPGPWFVHDFADPAVSLDPSPADVTVSCDHPATMPVASMGRALTATLEEARANAKLIAAAPDLLIQLKGMLGLAEFLINAIDVDTDQTKVVLRKTGEAVAEVPISVILMHAKAAIAKTEA